MKRKKKEKIIYTFHTNGGSLAIGINISQQNHWGQMGEKMFCREQRTPLSSYEACAV
jgi:hypothetical protein